MRAMVLERPGPVSESPLLERDLPLPEPGPSEIPIRTDVETFSLGEANRVLQRLKRAEIRGAAVLEVVS